MQNSKVVQALKTFSKEEFKEFEKFVASPFFRKGRKLTPLLKTLKKYYPSFTQRTLTKENIYSKLHSESYNDKLMRTLMSDLLKMCEEFLLQLAIRTERPMIYSVLSLRMSQRNIPFMAQKFLTVSEGFAEDRNIDNYFFRNMIFITEARIAYNLYRDKQVLVCSDVKDNTEYTLYFFISSISKFLHNLAVNKGAFNVEYENDVIMKFLRSINLKQVIAELPDGRFYEPVKMYLCAVISRLEVKDEKYYYMFRNSFFKHAALFDREEQYFLLVMLESLCELKIRKIDSEKFGRENFELIKFNISNELYRAANPKLSLMAFMFIFGRAFLLKEYEWLGRFTEKYIKEIDTKFRRDVSLFCNAHLNFAKGYYENALSEINRVELPVYTMKGSVYNLIMKIHYEKNNLNPALNLIDAYKHFLSNTKKIPQGWVEARKKFIGYYQKLILFKNGEKEFSMARLQKEIKGLNSLTERTWLLEKAEELLK